MSLFGSIQLGGNALKANDIGLQVVGQNIANASTPGYIREELNLVPSRPQQIGGLVLGLGVQVDGVVQKIDKLVEDRLRGANSDAESANTQKSTYEELESLLGELGKTDLGTSFTNFYNSINEVLNQPEGTSVRNLAVLRAQTLTQDFNRLSDRVETVRDGLNKQVIAAADDINRLTSQIRDLNVKIASTTGASGVLSSDAVGLTDQRQLALTELSKLIDIRVAEQPGGGVAVYAGGDYLVFDEHSRAVQVQNSVDRGLSIATIQVAETKSTLETSSGKVAGLVTSRDTILGGFLDKLDTLANTFAFEFNKVFASGQGLTGYQNLTSTNTVKDVAAPLDAAGLKNTPVNGSFEVQVRDRKTGLSQRTVVSVDLNGLDQDTSLENIVSQLNAISGLSASINSDGALTIRSTSADQEFAFANDSSGLLAVLGVNTLFTGSSATTLGVNQAISSDPGKFAASQSGIGEDTQTALKLATFQELGLESQGGDSIGTLYTRLTSEVTQSSAQTSAVAEGYTVFQQTLQAKSTAASGVSIDEEAIKMLSYQKAYQATAKYISVIAELLDVLVKL